MLIAYVTAALGETLEKSDEKGEIQAHCLLAALASSGRQWAGGAATGRALAHPLLDVPCQFCPHPHQVSPGSSKRCAVKYPPGKSNPKALLVIAHKCKSVVMLA